MEVEERVAEAVADAVAIERSLVTVAGERSPDIELAVARSLRIWLGLSSM